MGMDWWEEGIYTVKGGYKVAKAMTVEERRNDLGSSSRNCQGVWREVWKLKTPHKNKSFMWRLLSNALPTLDHIREFRQEESV